MLYALLALIAALQTAPSQPLPPTTPPPPPPVEAPPPPPAPEPQAEPEEEAPPVKTRQVCRYVDVSGQRFPVRTCRTVPVESDD